MSTAIFIMRGKGGREGGKTEGREEGRREKKESSASCKLSDPPRQDWWMCAFIMQYRDLWVFAILNQSL